MTIYTTHLIYKIKQYILIFVSLDFKWATSFGRTIYGNNSLVKDSKNVAQLLKKNDLSKIYKDFSPQSWSQNKLLNRLIVVDFYKKFLQ